MMNSKAHVDAIIGFLTARGAENTIAIAVSGGIDSLTLTYIAQKYLPQSLAYHAVSPAVPSEATRRVKDFALRNDWNLKLIGANEFEDEHYLSNPINRCFYCKKNLYSRISEEGERVICSGANTDDLDDYRPGLIAAADFSVLHPYIECDIDKNTIRLIARYLGLGDVAELPASPCLSSRVETNQRIEPAIVKAIDALEIQLREQFNFSILRVRYRHNGIAIELGDNELALLNHSDEIHIRRIVTTHFSKPLVSIEGYRMGSAFVGTKYVQD